MNTATARRVFSPHRSDQMLSLSAERSMITRAVAGDNEAMDALIKANAHLVRFIAKKYLSPNHPEIQLDDLTQEGSVGLWQAIQNFDLEKPNTLSTYAYYGIKRGIQSHFEKQARGIRLPAYLEQQLAKIKRVSENLERQLNRPPSTEELARELDTSAEKLDHLLQRIRDALKHQPIRLDQPMDSPSDDPTQLTLGETLPDEGENVEAATLQIGLREELHKLLKAVLTPTQAYIIARRYGLIEHMDYDNSYRQIAKELPKKISHERVRQIEEAAIKRLQQECRKPEHQQLNIYLLSA